VSSIVLAEATTVLNDSALLCSIQKNLPRGPAEIVVTQAYQTVNSSLYGFTPMAVCACGSYSLLEGQECVPCPEGAVCAGGSDKARARRDYWETIPSEWKAERFIKLTIPVTNPNSPVKPFVPCIERGMCGSDNTCLGNTTGWMCTSCIIGSNGVEMRRADDGISCEICSTEMTKVVFPASIGSAGSFVFLFVCFYIVSTVCCKRKESRLDKKAEENSWLAGNAKLKWTIIMLQLAFMFVLLFHSCKLLAQCLFMSSQVRRAHFLQRSRLLI
jgi:hypothetical protein